MSIGTAIAIVGTVLSAKTALDGLKEGNLLKAVAGGVGAYFGASAISGGLGGAAGSSADVVSGTAEGASGTLADQTVGANMADKFAAAGDVAGISSQNAMEGAGFANGASISGDASLNASLGDLAGKAGASSEFAGGAGIGSGAAIAPKGPGLLDRLGEFGGDAVDWVNKNPMAASGALQVGGGLLQGMAQEDMLDQKLAALEASRQRRQLTGATPFLRDTRYNPKTGRFEQVA